MKLGDIVRSSDAWRRDATAQQATHPHRFDPFAIITTISGSRCTVTFLNSREDTYGSRSLTLVYPLESLEAEAVYSLFKDVQRVLPYQEALQRAGLALPTPIPAREEDTAHCLNIPATEWQPGDTVLRVAAQFQNCEFLQECPIGGGGTFIRLNDDGLFRFSTNRLGRTIECVHRVEDYVLIHQVSATPPSISIPPASSPPPSPAEWQAGDILLRGDYPAPTQHPSLRPGTYWQLVEVQHEEAPAVIAVQGSETGQTIRDLFANRFTWSERPSTTAPLAVAPPSSYREWQPGDVLRRMHESNSARMREGVAVIFAGHSQGEGYINVTDERGEPIGSSHGGWLASRFAWVRRPVADAAGTQGVENNVSPQTQEPMPTTSEELTNLSIPPPPETAELPVLAPVINTRDWQVGDVLERIAVSTNRVTSRMRYVLREAINGVGNIKVSTLEGTTIPGGLSASGWRWISRPGFQTPTLVPLNNEYGRRIMMGNRAGNIVSPAPGVGAHRIWLDGEARTQTVSSTSLSPMLAEPAEPPLSMERIRHGVALSLVHANADDIAEFFTQLEGMGCKYHGDMGYGQRNGALRYPGGVQPYLILSAEVCYLYSATAMRLGCKGDLLRDWNLVLNTIRSLKESKADAAERVASMSGSTKAPDHALVVLPRHFVLERRAGRHMEEEEATKWLSAHGFTGTTGQYTLFSNNVAFGTSSKSLMGAFKKRHNAILLHGLKDAATIASLFKQQKHMLTSPLAVHKAAISVEASGTHLIKAFLRLMTASGYRQHNAEKADGPFILLNGGNLYPDQPMTWQYADTYNKRMEPINLQAAGAWDALAAVVTTYQTPQALLEPEDLERLPVAGDKVCLLDNGVSPDYPESAETLRRLVCGAVYTVKAVRGGLYQLDPDGQLLHPGRLHVLQSPRGVQPGDLVQMTTAYGANLKPGQVLVQQQPGVYLSLNGGEVFGVPAGYLTPVPATLLTEHLLKQLGLSLPFQAVVTDEGYLGYNTEVTITHAWPLNSQQLAFWTGPQEDPAKPSFYEQQHLRPVLATPPVDGEKRRLQVIMGSGPNNTRLLMGGEEATLAEVENLLANKL